MEYDKTKKIVHTRTVSFKVREDGRKWEEILSCSRIKFPVQVTSNRISSIANDLALVIANKKKREVRWQFDDTGQGHYIEPLREDQPTDSFVMFLDPTKRKV